MSIEAFWKKILFEKKFYIARGVLYGVSLLYACVLKWRHFLYDQKILHAKKVSATLVSIGNIAVGGTGKTPLTLLLADHFSKEVKTAILSRGYRSELSSHKKSLLVNSYARCLGAAKLIGDEPLLFVQKLPSVETWIGKNRFLSAIQAINSNCRLLFLEDGLQNRALIKDFEIVVVAATDPLVGGYMLPRGQLRELPERLQKADLIVINGSSDKDLFEKAKSLLASYSKAPCVGMVSDIQIANIPKSVAVICAIANPERFLKDLDEKGIERVETLILDDHAKISVQLVKEFAEKAVKKGAQALLCTEKDFVKISFIKEIGIPVLPIELHLKIQYNKPAWEEMIEKIRQKTLNLA